MMVAMENEGVFMDGNLQDNLTICQQENFVFDNTSYACKLLSMEIGERIRRAREKAGISQSELARRVGVKPQAVQAWEAGKNGPSRKRISSLAKELQISEEELEFGRRMGVVVLEGQAKYDPKHPSTIITIEKNFPTEKYAFIPRYDAKTSAGGGYHNGDHVEISKTHAFRIDWIRKNNWREEDLCVVEASGHSMDPHIRDGDVLLVNMSDKEFQDGKVYILLFPPEGLRAKRVHRMADGRIRISSDNPDKAQFPDEYYSPTEAAHLNIVGKVVQRSGEI